MIPTLAQEIALPECLEAQIVCLLLSQLDNRLGARQYALKRGNGITYVYAKPRESAKQQSWTFVHLLRERYEARCASSRAEVARVTQTDLTTTRFDGDNDGFIGTQVHMEGLGSGYSSDRSQSS
jgi:hypothetical protein